MNRDIDIMCESVGYINMDPTGVINVNLKECDIPTIIHQLFYDEVLDMMMKEAIIDYLEKKGYEVNRK